MNAAGPRIIACQSVINELLAMKPETAAICQAIEPGLHIRPRKLRAALQTAIDGIDGINDPIVLGLGLCAQAVVGLQVRASTLVIPRADDCIAIFLGSAEAYRKIRKAEPGTYFLSQGWIKAGITLIDELKTLADRYGAQRAARIRQEMLKGYKRLTFINMGNEKPAVYRRFSQKAAAELELAYHEIRGSRRLLNLIASGPWEEPDFVVVRPGSSATLKQFLT